MAVVQTPDQPVEGILLQELERVDEMLLEELELTPRTSASEVVLGGVGPSAPGRPFTRGFSRRAGLRGPAGRL